MRAAEDVVSNTGAGRRTRRPVRTNLAAGSSGGGQSGWSSGGGARSGRYYFDSIYQRVVDDCGELDHVLTGGVRGRGELLNVGDVLSASGGENVEIGQHLGAVDGHVERA